MSGATDFNDLAAAAGADAVRRQLDAAVPAAEPPADGDHFLRLVSGRDVVLRPVRWLWEGFLPAAMLTILGGAPGCGKTTLALALAATVTCAGRWPDGKRCPAPGSVLIWSGEDSHDVLAARLAAAGADMGRVRFVGGVAAGANGEERGFDPGRDMTLLELAAGGIPDLRLLILDPVVAAVTGDSHKNAEVRRSLAPVVDLAQRTGAAVLGITHFTKGTTGREPVERITGSLAFAAVARVVLVAAKLKKGIDDEPRRVLLRAKSNIGPGDGGFEYRLRRQEVAPEVEGQHVEWGAPVDGSAREILTEGEREHDDADGVDVGDFIREELADGPRPAKEIRRSADGAGHAWHTVQRAAKRMNITRAKGGMKEGWTWALPEQMSPEDRRKQQSPKMTEGDEEDSIFVVTPSVIFDGAEGKPDQMKPAEAPKVTEDHHTVYLSSSSSSSPSSPSSPSGKTLRQHARRLVEQAAPLRGWTDAELSAWRADADANPEGVVDVLQRPAG